MNASVLPTTEAGAPYGHASHYGLSVTDLHKRYGEREVLRGVSLTAQPGDVIAIVGSSGSGKSTLLRCLNLLEQPHAGTFKLGGETLALKPDRDGSLHAANAGQLQRWRARLAMVFQGFNLWHHRTALENVMEAPIHVSNLALCTKDGQKIRLRTRHSKEGARELVYEKDGKEVLYRPVKKPA